MTESKSQSQSPQKTPQAAKEHCSADRSDEETDRIPWEDQAHPPDYTGVGYGYKEVVDAFFERTTIMGVCQFGTRKGICWKLIWLVVSAMGISMAVYQSWDVIQDYHGKSIIQKLSFKSKRAPFPALTVCKTILLKTKVSTIGGGGGSFMTDDESDLEGHFVNDGITPADSLTYIQTCKFGTINCNLTDPDQIWPWTNPRYGRCFTFNPGFKSVFTADSGVGLYILLEMTDDLFSLESDFVVLMVHQSGTPPILDRSRVTQIYAKELVTVKMRARELIRLDGSQDCVPPYSKKKRKELVYYSEDSPYIYTMQACQKSCEISRRKRKFHCIDPSAIINNTQTNGDRWAHEKLCEFSEISYDIDQDFKGPCLCVTPCKETLLEDSIIKTSTTCKNPDANGNETALASPIMDTRSCAVIKLSYGNVPYEIIQEQRKYSDADFWGIIGGNVGLWVGICVVSLVELFELTVHIIREYILRMKKKRDSRGPTDTHGNSPPKLAAGRMPSNSRPHNAWVRPPLGKLQGRDGRVLLTIDPLRR